MDAKVAHGQARAPEGHGFIAFDETLNDTPQQHWMMGIAGAREIVLTTNDLGVQCAAAAGLGIAALPEFLGELYGLSPQGDPAQHIDRDAFVTCHADLRNSRAITDVATFLATCLPRPG